MLAGEFVVDRLDRGAGAGDRARARQARGLGNEKRPDASPHRPRHPRVAGGADSTRGRWEARRGVVGTASIHGGSEVADRMGRHPGGRGLQRCPGRAQQTRAAEAQPTGRARHPARRATSGGRRPAPPDAAAHGPSARMAQGQRRSDPPAGSRRVRRSQVLSISASRRAPRLRGCTARRAAPPPSATRAGGWSGLDEVSKAAVRGRSSRITLEDLSPRGAVSRSKARHAGSPRASSNRGVRPWLHLPARKGLAPESARIRGWTRQSVSEVSWVTRRISQPRHEARSSERPLTSRRCTSCRTQVPGPKSPE